MIIKAICHGVRVTNVSRHDSGDDLYEIITHSGREVKVTKSKSLIVWRDGEFKGIDTPDVRIGDCVPVCMNLPDPLSSTNMWILNNTSLRKNTYMVQNYTVL